MADTAAIRAILVEMRESKLGDEGWILVESGGGDPMTPTTGLQERLQHAARVGCPPTLQVLLRDAATALAQHDAALAALRGLSAHWLTLADRLSRAVEARPASQHCEASIDHGEGFRLRSCAEELTAALASARVPPSEGSA